MLKHATLSIAGLLSAMLKKAAGAEEGCAAADFRCTWSQLLRASSWKFFGS